MLTPNVGTDDKVGTRLSFSETVVIASAKFIGADQVERISLALVVDDIRRAGHRFLAGTRNDVETLGCRRESDVHDEKRGPLRAIVIESPRTRVLLANLAELMTCHKRSFCEEHGLCGRVLCGPLIANTRMRS